jgi:hypothetical protein
MISEEKALNQAMQRYQRDAYMDGTLTHDTYYLWLSDWIGLRELIVPATVERIRESRDPHLNDIPLAAWDSRHNLVRAAAFRKGIAWSQSDTVCCLKAMAKRMAERTVSE